MSAGLPFSVINQRPGGTIRKEQERDCKTNYSGKESRIETNIIFYVNRLWHAVSEGIAVNGLDGTGPIT